MTTIENELRAALLEMTTRIGAETGLSPGSISKRALGDDKWIAGVLGGRGFNVRSYDVCLAWFAENWPEGVAWPVGIIRPGPDDIAAVRANPAHKKPKP